MKMMLSLGWLFIAIVHITEPLISDNFNNCTEFFYKGQIPQGFAQNRDINSLAYICQKYSDKVYFASLYDRGRRIPLYSAYILDRRSECLEKRKNHFDVEPQLVNRQLNGNMQSESKTIQQMNKSRIQGNLESSQAVNADYNNTNYHRGHLNPVCHHANKDEQDATFTLTNAVPMNPKLNIGKWKSYELNILKNAKECTTMYVVTGIIPGNNWLKINRVNIPSHVWSAYCCVDNNNMPIKSGAGLIENDNSGKPVKEIEIYELQEQLKNRMGGTSFSIFQKNCSSRVKRNRGSPVQQKKRRITRKASSESGHLQPSLQAP